MNERSFYLLYACLYPCQELSSPLIGNEIGFGKATTPWVIACLLPVSFTWPSAGSLFPLDNALNWGKITDMNGRPFFSEIKITHP